MIDSVRNEIQATFREFEEGWNRHDAQAMALCWIEEGNAVDPWGRFALGRPGIVELLDSEHALVMAESRYRVMSLELRALSAGAVVVMCEALIEGARAPNGHRYDLPHKLEAVLVERDGRWRFLSLHPSFHHA